MGPKSYLPKFNTIRAQHASESQTKNAPVPKLLGGFDRHLFVQVVNQHHSGNGMRAWDFLG